MVLVRLKFSYRIFQEGSCTINLCINCFRWVIEIQTGLIYFSTGSSGSHI